VSWTHVLESAAGALTALGLWTVGRTIASRVAYRGIHKAIAFSRGRR